MAITGLSVIPVIGQCVMTYQGLSVTTSIGRSVKTWVGLSVISRVELCSSVALSARTGLSTVSREGQFTTSRGQPSLT